jgi:hypothetical protein
MKPIFAALLTLVFTFASAAEDSSGPPQVRTTKSEPAPREAELQTHGHYIAKDGQDVHAPAKSLDGKVPDGASARCRDGTYSFSKHHKGTCSGHGGVAQWN